MHHARAPIYDNGSPLFNKRSDSLFERRMGNDAAEEQDVFGVNICKPTDTTLWLGVDAAPALLDLVRHVRGGLDATNAVMLFKSTLGSEGANYKAPFSAGLG